MPYCPFEMSIELPSPVKMRREGMVVCVVGSVRSSEGWDEG